MLQSELFEREIGSMNEVSERYSDFEKKVSSTERDPSMRYVVPFRFVAGVFSKKHAMRVAR